MSTVVRPRAMAQTKNDKKREILAYLENKSEAGEVLDLRRDVIIEEFTDERYTEEAIDDLLTELLEEEPVSEQQPDLNIAFVDRFEERVTENVGTDDDWTLRGVFVIGFYVFAGSVLSLDSISNSMGITKGQIIMTAGLGIVLSYVFGQSIRWITNWLEARVPRLRKHKTMIYSIVGLTVSISMPIVAYSMLFSKELSAIVVATVFTGSIAGGIQLGKYFEKREERT